MQNRRALTLLNSIFEKSENWGVTAIPTPLLMLFMVFICNEKRFSTVEAGRKIYQRVKDTVIPKKRNMRKDMALECSLRSFPSGTSSRSLASSYLIVE